MATALAGCVDGGGPRYGRSYGYYDGGYYARPPAYGYGYRPGWGGYYGGRPPGYVVPHSRHSGPHYSGPPRHHSGPPPGIGRPPPSRGGIPSLSEAARRANQR